MYMTNMCPPCSSGIIIYTRKFCGPPWAIDPAPPERTVLLTVCVKCVFIAFLHV